MSLRAPMKHSHLRQVSAVSPDSSHSLGTSHDNANHDHDPSAIHETDTQTSSAGLSGRQVTIWVHDEAFSKEEILFDQAAFSDAGVKAGDLIEILPIRSSGSGTHPVKSDLSNNESDSNAYSKPDSKFTTPVQSRCLFLAKPLPQEIKARHPKLQISVTGSVANVFGFKNRTPVFLSTVDYPDCSASHVDISFRDQFMVRSDMWRLTMAELAGKLVHKGQKILFMGSIKATVKNIFIGGKKVLCGYFSPRTIPVFRSESAKYVLFIQMSREMWDFDSEGTGDILFSRVTNGFLPELFKRWANADARHLVTIVLFTRVEYETSALGSPVYSSSGHLRQTPNPTPFPTRDFYRVVVNDMASGHWTTILDELKKDFRTFLRDVSILRPDDTVTPVPNGVEAAPKPHPVTIAGRPSTALRGNILEAIHLASAHLAFDHIDRDMLRTGTSIIVITPGSGIFEVSHDSLASTTEALTNRGIAIDLVCLSPMPLHSVPLFKYRQPARRISKFAFDGRNSAGSSPEAHFSIGSGSKGMSPTSIPNPNEHIQSVGHRGSMTPAAGEWGYGIPHWLDISYWNPDTYREARRILKNDPNAPIPFTVTKQSKAFIPRLRMYEIQMMGVMESEQSNISIPYLLEGQGLSRLPNARRMPGYGATKAPLRSPKPQLSDSLRPEPFLQNIGGRKGVMFAEPEKTQKSALSWMDQYDEMVFRPVTRQTPTRRNSKLKRPSEPEVQSSGMHERVSARSISRLREYEMNPDDHGYPHATPRKIDPPLSVAKRPMVAKTDSPKKPAMKAQSISHPPKVSRNISFALRGLMSTPARAQASTEVKTEHAAALPMSNQRTSMPVFSDTQRSDIFSSSHITPPSTGAVDSTPHPASPESRPQESVPQEPLASPTQPISIKAAAKQDAEEQKPAHAEHPASFSSAVTEVPLHGTEDHARSLRDDATGSRDGSSQPQPNVTLSPWVRSVNPCNTTKKTLRDTTWFGRWQHAYPRPPHVAVVKWKSLKSPAILPLTTEEFPTATELASEYLQAPYRVSLNDDAEGIETPKTRGVLIREMVSLRLSHGFQIVVGKTLAEASGYHGLESLNVFDSRVLESDRAAMFLSKGNSIHRIICVEGGEIEVTRFTHCNSSVLVPGKQRSFSIYSPAMRTILNPDYEVRNVRLDSTAEEYNWNYADNYIAGHRDSLVNPAQQLHFWRVRYVLIPMQLQGHSRRHVQTSSEDNEEEIHLLGISQLTHIWQKNKYVAPEEKRFETSKRHQNPLNIMYQTRHPSEVVAAELDRILLTDPGLDNAPTQLLPESELLERSNVSISSLAQIIQGEKGVRTMDRRWHWRLHYDCFIGVELTTWLLQNFRDIESREEAVEFGNELMKHGLLQHVQKRHNFRDGNYFYQVSSEHRVTRPESRGSWFPQRRSEKSEKSVPSTPADDRSKASPASHARSDSRAPSTDEVPQVPPNTPGRSRSKVAIMLSKAMKYDVDPRKRSNRPEVIDLHYDRLHNPENCFHIELSWMSTTPKLIEDSVLSWATTAEKFGLKLVQVPVDEACSIDTTQPFRKPYRVRPKVSPPQEPVPPLGNSIAFPQTGTPDPLYYQKAILRKFDFVLDFEPRSAFPADVEVTYSWGKPEYKYAQYIHRSGSLLAQITDDGDYLLLANRLFSTRSALGRDVGRHDPFRPRPNHDTASPRLSPFPRPVQDVQSPGTPHMQSQIDFANLYRAPEYILSGLVEFCDDACKLEQFYSETHARPVSTKVGPAPANVMDSSIPSLELPGSVITRHVSPPSALGSRVSSDPASSPMGLQPRKQSECKGSPKSGSLRPVNEQ